MKHIRFILSFILVLALSVSVSALAATLRLPASLKEIEPEAFYGDQSLDEVILPEGFERIGARAFANSSIRTIYLPKSLRYIGGNALPSSDQLTVVADKDAPVYEWALEHGYIDNSSNALIEAVMDLAVSKLGTPYYQGTGYKTKDPETFDCSGFVYWCYYYGADIKLKDSARGQGSDDTYRKITSKSDLVRGDVVCFHPDKSSSTTCSHTGLYMGDGMFIHAATGNSNKVVITDINSDYYTRNFLWGRRIIE